MPAITKATIRRNNGKLPRFVSVFLFVTIFVVVAAIGNVFFFDRASGGDTASAASAGGGAGAGDINKSSARADVVVDVVDESQDSIKQKQQQKDKDTRSKSQTSEGNGNNGDNGLRPFVTGDALLYHHTIGSNQGKEAAIIIDMLMVHARAYMDGETYGGSCGEGNDVGRDAENSLLDAIGLTKELRFECPRENEYEGRKKMIAYRKYAEDGVRAMTPEYVNLLKSVTVYPDRSEVFSGDDSDRYTIVVHIKRGPRTSPCFKSFQGYDAYLPNLHYQHLIDKYMKPNARVIIFSQSDSYESFDEFKDRGYELHIDEDITDVWRSILVADVAILSRSSFSYVPAVVSKATVVYTPFWHKPIRGWDKVGKEVLDSTAVEFKRIQATCPVKKDPLAHLRSHNH
mmetsp:Transcript_47157/g.115172  ORF Transcript_47157/g.115172 Transcript_47157/m.115172 type:complete len:400 (-) Transcript_47157:1428-2627(-)